MNQSRPAPLGPGDLVLSDFDGTIATVDVGVDIITRLDLAEAWELEHRWRRGEIGSQECLAGQWGLVRMPWAELREMLEGMPLDESFPDLVTLCRTRRADLVVLSDGLDLYAYPLLQRLGLEPCAARIPLQPPTECLPVFVNHGEWAPEGVKVTFPYHGTDCLRCGTCKTDHLLALKPRYRRLIYLGDGYSDHCPVRHADLVFARGHLAEYCRRESLPHYPLESFHQVLRVLA